MYLDESIITGRGHRPTLPKTGALPRACVEAYYGIRSAFSNLNDSYGQVTIQVSLLPQEPGSG